MQNDVVWSNPGEHGAVRSSLFIVKIAAIEVFRGIATWDRRNRDVDFAHITLFADVLSVDAALLRINPHHDVLAIMESSGVFAKGLLIVACTHRGTPLLAKFRVIADCFNGIGAGAIDNSEAS